MYVKTVEEAENQFVNDLDDLLDPKQDDPKQDEVKQAIEGIPAKYSELPPASGCNTKVIVDGDTIYAYDCDEITGNYPVEFEFENIKEDLDISINNISATYKFTHTGFYFTKIEPKVVPESVQFCATEGVSAGECEDYTECVKTYLEGLSDNETKGWHECPYKHWMQWKTTKL